MSKRRPNKLNNITRGVQYCNVNARNKFSDTLTSVKPYQLGHPDSVLKAFRK